MDKEINFDYTKDMGSFYDGIMRTMVQQSDYRGMGGHGLEDSNAHGPHSQISIGIGDKTVNFRELRY